jgi:hypothetical protein
MPLKVSSISAKIGSIIINSAFGDDLVYLSCSISELDRTHILELDGFPQYALQDKTKAKKPISNIIFIKLSQKKHHREEPKNNY